MQAQELLSQDEVYDPPGSGNLAYTLISDPWQDGPVRVGFRVRWALDGMEEDRYVPMEFDVAGAVRPTPPPEG